MVYEREYPRHNIETQRYWQGCQKEKLLYQRCLDCGEVVFHPRAICPYCLKENLEWKESNGKGRIYSFSVIHRAPSEKWQDKVPYALGIVEMEEGYYIFTEFVNVDVNRLQINMPVKVVFDHVAEDLTLPKFEPLK